MFWSRSDARVGSVEVIPPELGLVESGVWVVGGVSYPSWREAWWEALAPVRASGVTSSRPRLVSPVRYFRPSAKTVDVSAHHACAVWELFVVEDVVELSQPEVSVLDEGRVGIDLVARGHEVRKLFFAGFGHRVIRHGYDPEEVLQEVYRGLLVRNKGKCPFDARKSSFGHYVHMVSECILNNYHRKQSRHREKEIKALDMPRGSSSGSGSDRELTEEGVLDRVGSLSSVESSSDLAIVLMERRLRLAVSEGVIGGRQAALAAEVLPYLAADASLGRVCPRRQDLEELGWRHGQSEWRQAVSALRQVLEDAG
jgi:hypothetical protein